MMNNRFSLLVKRKANGFTLMELIVVIAIITIVGAYILMHVSNAKEKAKGQECRANILRIYTALEGYKQNNMTIMATDPKGELMQNLIKGGATWLPPVKCPSDPLENDYIIVSDPTTKLFTICCLGTHARHEAINAPMPGYPQYRSRWNNMDPE